jgi:cold shock CspA family protein
MEKQSDKIQLRQLLLQNGLWLKKSSEGANSLMRAVSVCLYFTERYQEYIRKLVISYFKQRYVPSMKTDAQKKTMERYFENISLLEFEAINLEIISNLFSVEVQLYSVDNNTLKTEIYAADGYHQIKIVRIAEMNYAALFTITQKENFVLAQNLVLNIVESVVNKSPFTLHEINNGKLVNYDYKKWLAQSNPVQNPPQTTGPIDFNLYITNGNSSTKGCSSSPPNGQESRGNIGSEILSLFQKRKKSIHAIFQNYVQQNFIIDNFANHKIFLNNSYSSTRKNRTSKSSRIEKSMQQPKIHPFLNESLEIDPQKSSSNYNLESGTHENENSLKAPQLLYMDARKESNDDDFAAFGIGKDFDDFGKNSKLKIFESKISESALIGIKNLNGESEAKNNQDDLAKPKPMKESLKEKLIKKQTIHALKTELTRNISQQDEPIITGKGSLQSVERSATNLINSIKYEPSQKLISELKSGQSSKEKYTETIENRSYQGFLKFFDEKNGFGFFQIGKENEWEDVFVYKSEFDKANIKIESLKNMKNAFSPTFSFQIAIYFVNTDRRKKAINIKLV